MMAISMDRYLTVKNYRPAGQVVQRRQLLTTVVAATWMTAAIFSSHHLIPRNPWRKSLIIVCVVVVHIVPACTVLISHLGVHAKLTALSLTARAKHGELPLPMPLLRRPTHVIIVAGISKVLFAILSCELTYRCICAIIFTGTYSALTLLSLFAKLKGNKQ